MTTWVLILALYQPLDRLETLIPVAVPFASYDACWLAGYRASQLEDLNLSPGPAAKRIAWECVPTTWPAEEERSSCDSRPACRALREELRQIIRENRRPSLPEGAGNTDSGKEG